MKNKALVVIDIQNDITKNYKEIIDTINKAIGWAVSNELYVIYIKHNNLTAGTRNFKPDTRGAELVPELKVVSEHIFVKTKSNALTSEPFAEFIKANNQPQKTGSFTQNPDAYLMDFEVLQGKYSHVMELREGEVLVVHLEKKKGSFDVDIALQTIVGENIEVLSGIYTGNDVTGGDFNLPIEKSGTYKITVNGHHAKGVANFYVKDR